MCLCMKVRKLLLRTVRRLVIKVDISIIFDLHALFLNSHGTQYLTEFRNLLYYFLLHRFFPRSNESIKDCKGSMILVF